MALQAQQSRTAEPKGAHARVSLRANVAWTLAGNVAYAACQWGVLVALAKLGSPEVVGEFALALAITSTVLIGTGLNLRSVQASDASGSTPFSHYLSVRLLTNACAVIIVAGVIIASGYGRSTGLVVMIVAVAKAVEAVSDIFYGALQRNERMSRIAISMILRGALSVVAVATALYLTGRLAIACAALAGAWVLTLLLFDFPSAMAVLGPKQEGSEKHKGVATRVAALFQPVPSRTALLAVATLAAPVGVVMLLITLNGNAPRYFLEHYVGLRELGIFAAMIYPMQAGSTAVAAAGQSALPRLARSYASGKLREFRSLLAKMVALAVIIGSTGVFVIWMAGRQILAVLYAPEYATHHGVFLLLGCAAAVGYTGSMLGYGMTAARFFRAQLPVYGVPTIITVVGCLTLLPGFGLPGAAMVLLTAAVCQVAGGLLVIFYAARQSQHG